MNRRLVLRPEAAQDVERAALWYEVQASGLGVRFLAALESALDRILENPLQFQPVEEGVRRALLRRFPYGVYFMHSTNEVIVLAVLHLHQRPATWGGRGLRG